MLDVGCGARTPARRLAARTRHVDALDRSPVMLAAAADAAPPNVALAPGRPADRGPPRRALRRRVVSSAVLHHLSLADDLVGHEDMVAAHADQI